MIPTYLTHRAAPRRARSGMTLIEVMIAMFVMVIVFGAALSAVVQARSLAVSAKNRLRATAIMNMRMEEMRSVPFAKLKTNLELPASNPYRHQIEADQLFTGKTAYSFEWTRGLYSLPSSDEGTDLICAEVAVTWTEQNRPKSVRSVSYFSASGISTKQAAGS